jgi:superfamily I DNA and RNA helicase
MLQLFLKDAAAVLWMEDPLQNLRGAEPVELEGFVTYQEEGSFRTPASIATVIREALDVDLVERNKLPGLGVRVEAYEAANEQFKLVAHRVNELKKEGFTDDNIVIVSCRGMGSATFSEAETIGPHPIRRFTGKYTSDGRQIYTDGRLYFDTIYRFKGQQAPAVILVDIDESLADSDKAKRVLYCGMTRASVRLEMIVQKSNPWLEKLEKAA